MEKEFCIDRTADLWRLSTSVPRALSLQRELLVNAL